MFLNFGQQRYKINPNIEIPAEVISSISANTPYSTIKMKSKALDVSIQRAIGHELLSVNL
jgi:hypothetical protein